MIMIMTSLVDLYPISMHLLLTLLMNLIECSLINGEGRNLTFCVGLRASHLVTTATPLPTSQFDTLSVRRGRIKKSINDSNFCECRSLLSGVVSRAGSYCRLLSDNRLRPVGSNPAAATIRQAGARGENVVPAMM